MLSSPKRSNCSITLLIRLLSLALQTLLDWKISADLTEETVIPSRYESPRFAANLGLTLGFTFTVAAYDIDG